MDQKTKNIISIVIILVLVVCLAFTIGDNGETKREVVNFNMPTTTSRKTPSRNNRFNLPQRDNETEKNKEPEKSDETEKKEDATLDKGDEVKENSKCKCQETRPQIGNWNNPTMSLPVTNSSENNSLKTALIVIESFLLGGTVMFLILNNLDKEIVEENKTKTRRVK